MAKYVTCYYGAGTIGDHAPGDIQSYKLVLASGAHFFRWPATADRMLSQFYNRYGRCVGYTLRLPGGGVRRVRTYPVEKLFKRR